MKPPPPFQSSGPPPFRVLISGGLAVGGPQTHLTVLCDVLVRAGAEVTVAAASTNWSKEALANLRSKGVRIVVSPFGYGRFQLLGKIWAFVSWPFLLRRDHDVVCCLGEGRMHLWANRFLAPGAWRIYHELVSCPLRGSVAAQVAGEMDAIVANSRVVAEDMRALFPALPVQEIPFLTSGGPLQSPARRQAPGPRELRIAFLGRLVPHKRPDRLIESWAAWSSSDSIGPVRLDIYGGDYDHEGARLRARVSELRLDNTVRIHGGYETRDLPAIFSETDLVVLPSLHEGLPLVLVEAMQRGIPVVATAAGGTSELGDDNPDVSISPGTGWPEFEAAFCSMILRIRQGEIDSARLHEWTEQRYGFGPVSVKWREALLNPPAFFAPRAESMSAREPQIVEAW